jgi:hypothetical protein
MRETRPFTHFDSMMLKGSCRPVRQHYDCLPAQPSVLFEIKIWLSGGVIRWLSNNVNVSSREARVPLRGLITILASQIEAKDSKTSYKSFGRLLAVFLLEAGWGLAYAARWPNQG